jgi:class 3 adenylate cyclase/tetratricopeptide (TPR) repeat protein
MPKYSQRLFSCIPSARKIFLLFFFLPVISFSQQRKADSLKILLSKAQHDTTRLFLQKEIGLAYIDISQDSSLAWWKAAYAFAEENKSNLRDPELNRFLLLEGEVISNIGFIYTNRGMTLPALDFNFKSLQLRESIGDKHGIAESLNNIAFIYGQQNDPDKALEYYARSAAGYTAINDMGGVAFTLVNRATIYSKRKQDSLALDMYAQAMKILSSSPELQRGYSTCLNNIGNIYMRMKRYPEAMHHYRLALEVREKNNDQFNIAATYVSIGKLYEEREMPDSAFYFTEKAYELAQKNKNSQIIMTSAQLLSDLYKAKGDYKLALDYRNIYIAARDTVNSKESGKQMVRQQMSYEYAKEKELSEIKLAQQRNYTIGGFSALAVVALLLFFVYRQRNGIARAKKRSDELLLNILPAETAEELKATGTAKTKSYSNVTVMFTDFKNFTQTAELLSAEELVALINFCYGEFDKIVSRHNVEKIKTIGDSYMCAGGLPVANETHAEDAVGAAIDMLAFIKKYNEERRHNNLPFFDIRIGLHTGPVVAGIVGTKKFAYDIWGDAVNIASRMESSGEPGRINISESTFERVKNKFSCEYRGKVKAKNKGEIDMYFVNAPLTEMKEKDRYAERTTFP